MCRVSRLLTLTTTIKPITEAAVPGNAIKRAIQKASFIERASLSQQAKSCTTFGDKFLSLGASGGGFLCDAGAFFGEGRGDGTSDNFFQVAV
jgi:hypothetical protein